MGKWAAAASDAAKAYNSSAPYSVTEVSQPTFYNATNNAWIFGIVVTTEDYLAKTGWFLLHNLWECRLFL